MQQIDDLCQTYVCQKNKTANLMCCSQICFKPVFVCGCVDCCCVPQYHPDCQFLYYQSFIERVKLKKLVLPQQTKKGLKQIEKLYQKAIKKLSQDKDRLLKWQSNYNLTYDEIYLLDNISKGNIREITGSLIYKIKQNFKKQRVEQSISWLTQQWVLQFWEKHEEQFKRIFRHLDKFHPQKYIINNQLIPSVIVQEKQKLSWLFQKNIHKLKLLYRASQNKFSAEKFHEKCDGIKGTLTIALTDSNKILGGYTNLSWQSTDRIYVSDESLQSFVFNLSEGKKYKLRSAFEAIQNHKNQGPTFGKVYSDLYISDQSHQSNQSIWNAPNTYCLSCQTYKNSKNNSNSSNIQQKYMHICIKQWQVFKVTFENI